MTASDEPGPGEDRMDDLKRQIAAQHLGDPDLGPRLRGGNAEQLRADAERLRDEAHVSGSGRPSMEAAVWTGSADVPSSPSGCSGDQRPDGASSRSIHREKRYPVASATALS